MATDGRRRVELNVLKKGVTSTLVEYVRIMFDERKQQWPHYFAKLTHSGEAIIPMSSMGGFYGYNPADILQAYHARWYISDDGRLEVDVTELERDEIVQLTKTELKKYAPELDKLSQKLPGLF